MPILSLPVCAVKRSVLLEAQMAEQWVEVPKPFFIFEQNADIPVPHRLGGHRLVERNMLTFLLLVEAFVVFSQDRVQLPFRRRSLTFLVAEVLTVFSPDRVLQRLELRMLTFRLVEVCTVYAQGVFWT